MKKNKLNEVKVVRYDTICDDDEWERIQKAKSLNRNGDGASK